MFEQIVRPFQTRDVLQTRRIVKSLSTKTGERAFLTWGAAGTIPAGALQPPPTPAAPQPGFNVIQDSPAQWVQTEEPVTEEVQVGGVTIKRVRAITFHTLANNLPGFEPTPINSTVAAGVSDVVAGLLRDISGTRAKTATYKTTWE
jgi:hypothetical protein